MDKKINKKKFIKKVFLLFKPFWKYIVINILLLLVIQLMGTFAPYLFGKSVDAITNHNARLTLLLMLGAFAVSLFQSEFLWYIKEHIEINKLDSHIEKHFSTFSLKKMLNFSIGQHINEHSGIKQTIVNKGQSSLTQLMYMAFYNVLPNVIQILVTLLVLFIFDWRVASTAFIFAGLYIYMVFKRNKKSYLDIDEIRKKNQAQSKLQSELYRNSNLVISEGQEEEAGINF